MEKTFYITKEQFATTTATWKSKKAHTVAEHIIYNILRSKPADHGFEMKHKALAAQLGNAICWKAFNDAIDAAKWSITKRQFGTYDPDGYFKSVFGIEIPVDLKEKFDGSKK